MRIQVEKITGLADENHTPSVFSKRVETGSGTTGTLVGCALAKNGNFTDLPTTLHSLFEITASKIEGVGDSIGDQVLEALSAAKSFVLEHDLDASFAICFFYQKACYVIRFGEKVKVWTFRAGKSQELGFEYGSGPYEFGQYFALGTEKFFTTFDTSTLLVEEGLDLEEIIDGLATDISSDSKQSEIGVAFIKIGIDDEQNIEQVEKQPIEQTLAPREIQARDEVDSRVFEEGEDVVSKKRKFSLGKIGGGFFGAIINEIGKLSRGDIRAIFRLRRSLVMVALLLLVVLAGSAFFTINNQKQASKVVEFKRQVESAKTNLAEGESIISLNSERARTKLIEASGDITRALALFPKDEESVRIKSEIENKLKETENVSGLPFREVANIAEGLVSLARSKDGLVGFSNDKIFEISLDGTISGSGNSQKGTFTGFVWDDSAFVMAEGKIVKVGLDKQKEDEVVNIDFGRDIAVFLGNVYVLTRDQILKFVPIEKGYGDGALYLEKKEEFGDFSRMAIDGSIWVTQNSQILKYNRGKKENFSIQGLVQTDVAFGEIYTNSDIDNLYVIDKLNGALLVIGKDGVFQRVYQSFEFENNPTFVIDEASGKVYIASGSKILVANL